MDDLRVVADLLDQGPPAVDTTAAGRRRLGELIDAAAAAPREPAAAAGACLEISAAPEAAARRGWRGWRGAASRMAGPRTAGARAAGRRSRRLPLSAVAATVAAIVGTGVVVAGPFGDRLDRVAANRNRPGGDAAERPRDFRNMSAVQIMNIAGDQVADGPDHFAGTSTGAYWHTRKTDVSEYWAKGKGDEFYVIEQRSVNEKWEGDTLGDTVIVGQDLGARPVTAADTAAWRRAGRPGSWPMANGTSIKSGAKSPFSQRGAQGSVPSLDKEPTRDWLFDLPSDATRLKEYLLRERAVEVKNGSDLPESRGGLSDTLHLYLAATRILAAPAPRKAWAAALRLIGGLPGARAAGTATDPLGRPGQVISLRLPEHSRGVGREASHESSPVEEQLIVDPVQGRLLATRDITVDDRWGRRLIAGSAYETMGWTRQRPPLPPVEKLPSALEMRQREKAQAEARRREQAAREDQAAP